MANFNVISGQAAVASAGTAVQLAATTVAYRYVRNIVIKADPDNTVDLWIGNDNAGDVTTSNGYQMKPGDVLTLDMTSSSSDGDERLDISSFWIDSASGTPGVHYIVTYG